ncbi:uncharacterized protein LOC124359840 isoform X2 [Homalodisca vitripennis]|uniref:uncharacterized protein LOC124359840 isoform X2 n=1 Tax=Homalodisca vitripennis TaxID=197043 RepID=UPI001EEA690A|nr:uncharacterized protein LOC124359840 isoform X2 [Homalodisca vitripennis]
MPLAGLADPVDPWQRIQVKEEVETASTEDMVVDQAIEVSTDMLSLGRAPLCRYCIITSPSSPLACRTLSDILLYQTNILCCVLQFIHCKYVSCLFIASRIMFLQITCDALRQTLQLAWLCVRY